MHILYIQLIRNDASVLFPSNAVISPVFPLYGYHPYKVVGRYPVRCSSIIQVTLTESVMKEPCVAGGSWVCPRWAVGNMETGSASARERERSLMKVAGGTSVQA